MAQFPTHYVPRPYQEELHRMWRSKRYGLAVLPRQSGKDVAASMEQCDARLRTPKTTGVYIGLFASNPSSARMAPADFDWFEYEPAGD